MFLSLDEAHVRSLTKIFVYFNLSIYRKMSIGKIDCTVEKSVCKRFNVKGYPTLKYYRDGDFQEYPLGRDKDSIM